MPADDADGGALLTGASPGEGGGERAVQAFVCAAGLHRRRRRFTRAEPCTACRTVEATVAAVEALTAALDVLAGPDVVAGSGLGRGGIEDVVTAVAGTGRSSGERCRQLCTWLAGRPDPLGDGDSNAPVVAQRLLAELRRRGVSVTLPRCAGCGRPTSRLVGLTVEGRICLACYARTGHEPCGRCGRARRVNTRDQDGTAVCAACRRADPATWQHCGRCGTFGGVSAVEDGVPIGRCCYVRPMLRCTVCGTAPGNQPYRTRNPVCTSCMALPRLPCTSCGADALDPRPDSAGGGRAGASPDDRSDNRFDDSSDERAGDRPGAAGTGEVSCARCRDRPPLPCSSCRAPTANRAADGTARCVDCYQRPNGTCGRCGRTRAIVRLAADGDPDLCGLCWRGPVTECARCGRRRSCRGERAGEMLCGACQPGRPLPCAFCGRRRRVCAHWPDGPVCGSCFARRRRVPGPCPLCGQERRLLRRTRGEPACAACLGVPEPDVCGNCGARDEPLWDRGRCPRCTLANRLAALLDDVPAVLGVEGLRGALLEAPSARAVLDWLTRTDAADLLTQITRGDLPCTHQALDALPATTTSVHHLRHLLVAVGMLPERDPVLAGLTRWTRDFLTELPAEHADLLRLYTRWQLLRPLQEKSRHAPLSDATGHAARTRLRSAAAFLAFLTRCGHSLATCQQADIDAWLADHPDHRTRPAGSFVAWATARHAMPTLDYPRTRTDLTTPILDPDQRWAAARRLLHDAGIDPADRVAGALVVIYGQTLARIAHLRHSDVTIHQEHGEHGEHHDDVAEGGPVTMRLGRTAITLPEPLAGYVRALATGHRQPSTARLPQTWLFPSRTAKGRPVSPLTLGNRLSRIDIRPSEQRAAALFQLCTQMPAAVLADLLGISITTATKWADLAGRNRSDYLQLPPATR